MTDGVLPIQDGGDFESLGEFSLPGAHPAKGDVVFTVGEGSLGIDDGDLTDAGEFLQESVKGQIDSGLVGDLSGQSSQEQCQNTIESVDSQFLIGPVVGGLPVEEVEVLHVFEGFLDIGETAVGFDDLLGFPVEMVGDEEGASQALIGEFFQCLVIDGIL